MYEWSDETSVSEIVEGDLVFLVCGRASLDSTRRLVQKVDSEGRALAYSRFEPTIGCRPDDLIRKPSGFKH